MAISQDTGREPVWELAYGRSWGTWGKSLGLGYAAQVGLSHSHFVYILMSVTSFCTRGTLTYREQLTTDCTTYEMGTVVFPKE